MNSITNPTSKANVENIIKNWSDDLLTKLDNVPSRNAKFLSDVETNPSILNYFEEGSKIISNKSPNLKAVELDAYAIDRATNIEKQLNFVQAGGKYTKNPTATNVDDLEITVSGKIKGKKNLNPNTTQTTELNGTEYMYVIDESNNIIIGTRVKNSEIPNFNFFNGKAPHPTLLGGVNPNIKAAGTIEFRGGFIYKVDNASGHFKPEASTMDLVETLFKQKFPSKSFNAELLNTNQIFKKLGQ